MTLRAMNNGYRLESMQSYGTVQLAPNSPLGLLDGRRIVFGQDTISSSLVVLWWIVSHVAAQGFETSVPRRLPVPIAILVAAVMLYMIGTRQTILGFLLLLALAFPSVRLRSRVIVSVFVVAALCGVIVLSEVWVQGSEMIGGAKIGSNFLERTQRLGDEFDGSEHSRLNMLQESWQVAVREPFLGQGFNSKADVYYVVEASGDKMLEFSAYPHGVIASLLRDRGLVFMLAFMVPMALVLWRAAVTALGAQGFGMEWSLAVILLVMPLGGAWLSGIYWSAFDLMVPLSLIAFARLTRPSQGARDLK